MPERDTFEISRLGAQGDGVVDSDAGPHFVARALPGETWRQTGEGCVRVSSSPQRRQAPCPHFEHCGGCVAQHMSDALYASWKSGLVRQALAHQGIDIEPLPLWRATEGSRRRVALSAEPTGGDVRLGFRAAGSHELVGISTCVIAKVEIVAALPALKELLQLIGSDASLTSETRVHVLAADNGLDVTVEGVGARLGAATRQRLAEAASGGDIQRLVVGGEEIYQGMQPVLYSDGIAIRVPPGVFVQAVGEAETRMAKAVVDGVGRAKRVADLFCGVGAFALPLARRARVFAADSDAEAILALSDAVRHAQGLKPVEAIRRDLFREPLSRTELRAFEAVVFDPPRAGAAAQAEALAKSRVPTVVAVSCNPATLARDLRTLIDGGYKLRSVLPVDQFLYSAHVEAVAVLGR